MKTTSKHGPNKYVYEIQIQACTQLSSFTNKKVRKTAHCAPSAHLLWLKSSKIIYKIVYEIQIQGYTQNYNCLASQTKKLEKQPTVHPVHTFCD